MGANIITGYTGSRHITPAMDASVYRAAFGGDEYVMSDGNKLEGSMPTINDFSILDGLVSMQGHMIQVTQETLTVDTCATGYERIDLVCLRFMHDNSTLIDSSALVVIKGSEVQEGQSVQEPSHYTGVIDEGASAVDMPLYRINLSGSTVTYTKLFDRAYNPDEQKANLLDLFYPVGSYYETSNTSFNPNVSWGGTWSLETEGQVHVSGSSGGTYRINGALTNTTDGGASSVLLTDAQMAHGHSMTQPAFTIAKEGMTSTGMSANQTHSHNDGSQSGVSGGLTSGYTTIATVADAANGTRSTTSANLAHTHKVPSAAYSVPRTTNAAVSPIYGASSTRTAHNNMQPYIVVNRWHRTA